MSVLGYVMCACAQTVAVTFIIKHVRNWPHNIFRLGLPHGQSSHDCVKENKKRRWWVWSVLLLYPLNESFYLLSMCVNLCSHPVYASPNLLHGRLWYLYDVLVDECFYVYRQKCPVSVPHSWLNCTVQTHTVHLTFLSVAPVSVFEKVMTSAALSCVPHPVCEPTIQCQSGCALLSICLKRHLHNQEPVWILHFGFCHVTVWIFLIGMESSCRTAGALSVLLHCFQISPWKRGKFSPVTVQRVQHHYLYPHYIGMYHSQDLELFLTFLSLYYSTSPQPVPDWPDFTATVRILKMLCEAFLMLWIFAFYATYQRTLCPPGGLVFLSM